MGRLAINGGTPVRNVKRNPWPKWPVWDKRDEKALLGVLRSGVWSYNGPAEKRFNKAFAGYIGSRNALSLANGTVTLQLALEACGIGYGDEVIVPGLTWQATAAAALDINAVPVIVDVTEDTWCIDPAAIEAAITPATRAIIPVHLYGCMADMDAILQIAERHGLRVIEDCADKHGGEWNGMKAGSIGDIGSFSFQLSKLMTAGEGGALTTSDPELWEKLDALRNCGRRPEQKGAADKGAGIYGDEGNFIQSGNYRITEFQAALLTESLHRLSRDNKVREKNATYFNAAFRDSRRAADAPGRPRNRPSLLQLLLPVQPKAIQERPRDSVPQSPGCRDRAQRRGQLPAAQCVLPVRPAHQALAVQADGAALETDRPEAIQAARLRPDSR